MRPLLRRLSSVANASAAPRVAAAAAAPTARASLGSIPAVLSAAAANSPLKDAVKFTPQSPTKSTIWTYAELSSHVSALATGLAALSYPPSSKILCVLPPSSPEYTVLLLAAAHLHLTVLPYPTDAINPPDLADAIRIHAPRMLLIAHDLQLPSPPSHSPDDIDIVASTHPLLHALDPSLALNDARGVAGFATATAAPIRSALLPSLSHVVHTGPNNIRPAIAFRSLLVYSQPPSPALHDQASVDPAPPLLLHPQDPARSLTHHQLLDAADELAAAADLSADHAHPGGKVAVNPDASPFHAATAAAAALMRQSLWLSPHPDMFQHVSAHDKPRLV